MARWTLAFVITLVLYYAAADAETLAQNQPCPKGQSYVCEGRKCSCVRNTGANPYWYIFQADQKEQPLDVSAKGSGTSEYNCSPELQQCSCNGFIDCADMFLHLEVKCESFVCGGFGCTCHFPNNIPAN